jgi:hypothetical protein
MFKFERRVLIQCLKILASCAAMSLFLSAQQYYMGENFMNHGFKLEAIYILILIFSGMFIFFTFLGMLRGYSIKGLKGLSGLVK